MPKSDLELELSQAHMTQKPMLRVEVGREDFQLVTNVLTCRNDCHSTRSRNLSPGLVIKGTRSFAFVTASLNWEAGLNNGKTS
jgi:hypothetical protein